MPSTFDFFDAMTELIWGIQHATGGTVHRAADGTLIHLAPDGDITGVESSGDMLRDLQHLQVLVVPTKGLEVE